jgi:hypothetical protein
MMDDEKAKQALIGFMTHTGNPPYAEWLKHYSVMGVREAYAFEEVGSTDLTLRIILSRSVKQ